MAKNTKERICNTAKRLFSDRQFEEVSIAEICREASVSNGVYYRYFKNKEELIKTLIEDFLTFFRSALMDIEGETIEEKLYSFISIVLGVGKSHVREISIFREGQYRFYGYEDKLRQLYIERAEFVFGRSISEVEYIYILSGLRFCSIRALYNGMKVNPSILRDFILEGVFPDLETGGPGTSLPDRFISPPPLSPSNSLEKLINSGIRLFGEKGFHNTGVADVARECGLAVGTFYSYFESKEAFPNTIVLRIGEQTRHYLSEHIARSGDRLNQEITGMWHFLNYFHDRLEFYSIVREAEFVVKEAVNQYYNSFEKGYLKNLEFIKPEEKRLHAANFLIGLSHYSGIEVLHRKRIIQIGAFMEDLSVLLHRGISLDIPSQNSR